MEHFVKIIDKLPQTVVQHRDFVVSMMNGRRLYLEKIDAAITATVSLLLEIQRHC